MNKEEIKNDLDFIEQKIEVLRVDYEKFFVGIIKAEPTQLRKQIDRIIRKYTGKQMNNVMLSFRYKNIVSRYLTYQEYWNRILKLIEEGKNPKDYRKISERYFGKPQSPLQKLPTEAEPIPSRQDKYLELYNEYSSLLKKHNKVAPNFDAFKKTILHYETNIKDKYGENAEADFEFDESASGIKIKTKIKKK